ncbi:hypothetical protein [Maritalea mediterranea]|uniref:DUF3899 domain-containing protein n=1 Tax=Maritalea mediterranea TaxID=2909667 RepID=A0ABS9E888_9HYPH|nr:hypothetical protein [Maritalea mediterranea]MCF4099094.1 hypothetical protein [Maritalea mediterranea]
MLDELKDAALRRSETAKFSFSISAGLLAFFLFLVRQYDGEGWYLEGMIALTTLLLMLSSAGIAVGYAILRQIANFGTQEMLLDPKIKLFKAQQGTSIEWLRLKYSILVKYGAPFFLITFAFVGTTIIVLLGHHLVS